MKDNLSELSEVLIAENLISENDAYLYEKQADKEGFSLYQYLFIKNIISENDISYHISHYYKIPYINIEYYLPNYLPEIKETEWIENNLAIPIKKLNHNNGILFVVLSELNNIKEIEAYFKKQYKVKIVEFLVCEETKLNKYIADFIKSKAPEEQIASNTNLHIPTAQNIVEKKMIDKSEETEANIENETESQNDKPLVEFIQKILIDSINGRVSDIHFEPYDNYYRIRFRQNGELYDTSIPPFYIKDKLTEKIKNISKMDINSVMPQTGRINLQIFGERDVDFRVSTFPTLYGEKIVMQVQDPDLAKLDLNSLGLTPDQVEIINLKQEEKSGLILFTGAPRSGKSLSAYNLLEKKSPQKLNIYAIEKTTSLKIKGINQLLLNPNSGLKPVDVLEQLIYQDSDIILLEDIQQKEELYNLRRLSDKGSLIISTLNAKTLREAILKLMKMGMSIIEIVNEVKMISYQVMIAKLCKECKVKENWSRIPLINIGFTLNEIDLYDKTWTTYNSIGCPTCNNRKTKGSTVSFQILNIDEKLKQLIYENANSKSEEELLELLLSGATSEIKHSILDKIKKGEISYGEAENYFKKI